jgi:hypothetical protein
MQSAIYNWLDQQADQRQYTEQSEHVIRRLVMITCMGANVITLATRVMSIAETFFKGLSTVLSIPFISDKVFHAQRGMKEIFMNTPLDILRLLYLPIDLLDDLAGIFIDPKYFTMLKIECLKINLPHAKQGTLHSERHKANLQYIGGVVKPKFMNYQQAVMAHRDPSYAPEYVPTQEDFMHRRDPNYKPEYPVFDYMNQEVTDSKSNLTRSF